VRWMDGCKEGDVERNIVEDGAVLVKKELWLFH
jgi:hypothetical protein